jgi:hypothetical protein
MRVQQQQQQQQKQVISQQEDEFPSLASASKIKKAPTVVTIKGAINFAEAAKKKALPQQQQLQQQQQRNNKSNNNKATTTRGGYYNGQLMKKLTQPVHIPWLDTGSTLNSIYMKEVYIYIYITKVLISHITKIIYYYYRENRQLNMVC